jgi:hypothetical protein
MTHLSCLTKRSTPQTHLPPSASVPIRSTRCGHWKAGIKKSPGKVSEQDMIGAHQSTRTYIKCTVLNPRDTFERELFGVERERGKIRRVNMCTGPCEKSEKHCWRHPRLDCGFCWSPFPDKLLTVLKECSVVFLLVFQPGFERATAGKGITIIRGRG